MTGTQIASVVFSVLSFSPIASAFPDLIRHGYTNCVACHVSPTGGGPLNLYGRSLSREILSTWGFETESAPLSAAFGQPPEWLIVGGDVRAIQVHRKSPFRRQGRIFLMQANLDLGFRVGEVTAVFSIGQVDTRTNEMHPHSNRYYAMWNANEQLAVRMGRFTPIFGLNVQYHTLPTRQSLGFGPGGERDAVESVWSGENWNLAASASRTPWTAARIDSRETLVTAQINRTIGSTSRIGASYLTGTQSSSEREALGLHGLLGLSERWAYLVEVDHQRIQPHAGSRQFGVFHFSQLVYEATKGLQLYILEDYQKSNLADSRTLVNSVGAGFRFYPRPHFELDLAFFKRRTASEADRYDDFAWLLAHYYL